MSGAGPLSPPIASIAIFQAMAPPSPDTSFARNPMPLFLGLQDLGISVIATVSTDAVRQFGFLAAGAKCHPPRGEFPMSPAFIAARLRGFSLRNRHELLLTSPTGL